MELGADDFLLKNQIESRLLTTIGAQLRKKNRFQKRMQSRMKIVSKNISYALPHEFRTALNEINNLANYLDQMADRIEKDEINEIAQDIIKSNKRLMKITENFLVFARIQEFNDNPEKLKNLRRFKTEEPISIVNNIAETIAQKYERENDVYIENGNDHLALEISSENFFKIFSELIDNAFKFSNKQDIINIHHWLNEEFLYFEINDNGRGMNDQQIANIGILSQFERDMYEQQGIGLGLTIAKSLVELHGGTFKIVSKQGIGTDIVFRLHVMKKES
jgi:K+-sensing histidine kinase KdpD